jgi:AcrR family transcriptional regulator
MATVKRDTLRERFADDVAGEIKRAALKRLVSGGPAEVSVNALGRDLGVSGPALYRYFPSRDALLTALSLDAYRDLTDAVAAAIAARRTEHTRLAAAVTAYRDWALANPDRYRLLFRAPLPGYDPNTAELVTAAQAAMNVLMTAFDPGARRPDRRTATVLPWLSRRGLPAEQAPVAHAAVTLWTRLHGLVALEIEGCFASMGLDPERRYEPDDLLAGT